MELSRILISHQFKCYNLFVYGTLKSDGANHSRFMAAFKSMAFAQIHGYQIHYEMGMIFISPSEYEEVQGEFYTFDSEEDFSYRLSRLDKFEWFEPEAESDSLYERILVSVVSKEWDGEKLAWAYAAGRRKF